MNEPMFSAADILQFMASLTTWPVLCENFIKAQCIFIPRGGPAVDAWFLKEKEQVITYN